MPEYSLLSQLNFFLSTKPNQFLPIWLVLLSLLYLTLHIQWEAILKVNFEWFTTNTDNKAKYRSNKFWASEKIGTIPKKSYPIPVAIYGHVFQVPKLCGIVATVFITFGLSWMGIISETWIKLINRTMKVLLLNLFFLKDYFIMNRFRIHSKHFIAYMEWWLILSADSLITSLAWIKASPLHEPIYKAVITFTKNIEKILSLAVLFYIGYFVIRRQWLVASHLVIVSGLLILKSICARVKTKKRAKNLDEITTETHECYSRQYMPHGDWLNQVLEEVWPLTHDTIAQVLRGPIQDRLRQRSYPTFTFGKVSLGDASPIVKITKISHLRNSSKESHLLVEVHFYYDSNCLIDFSVCGMPVGCVRNFKISGDVNVILKPLMQTEPIIGGFEIYCTKIPEITYEYEGISKIFGYDRVPRAMFVRRLKKFVVYPNKISQRWSSLIDLYKLFTNLNNQARSKL